MTTLNRLVLSWAGPQVKGLAVTVLHFDGSDNAAPPVAAVKAAFDPLLPSLPSGLTISYPSSGDRIDDTTGDLTGVWAGADIAPSTATGVARAAAGVGACIGWSTGGIVNGTKGPRKLRGRTFLVPLSTDCYDSDGTIGAATLGILQGVANSLQASGPLAVWHRPTAAGATNGTSYGVIANKVRDHVAFLGSRRD